MKTYYQIWIFSVFLVLCSDASSIDTDDADVAVIRNALSGLPRDNPMSRWFAGAGRNPRMYQLTRWLGRTNPRWHHTSHNQLLNLIHRWHSGYSSFHHMPNQARTTPEPRPLDFQAWYRRWLREDVGDCGHSQIRTPSTRIIGGTQTVPGKWPWMVSLEFIPFKQHVCGGMLISKEWVVTAAHCLTKFFGEPFTQYSPRLGKYDTTPHLQEATEQDFNTVKAIFHPLYASKEAVHHINVSNNLVSDHDIVLLKLDHPATFNEWVRPICLPRNYEIPETGRRCTILGWGVSNVTTHTYLGQLREAQVPIYDHKTCKKLPPYAPILSDNMLCAGYKEGKTDTCLFDSGGPLQCWMNNKWVVSGITSWGGETVGEPGCGEPYRPGVYTNVVNYVEWIHRQIYEDYKETFSAKHKDATVN